MSKKLDEDSDDEDDDEEEEEVAEGCSEPGDILRTVKHTR